MDEKVPKIERQPTKIVALMDTTYWGCDFGVVIIKDAISGFVLWHKFIERKEHIDDYIEGINILKNAKYEIVGVVCDGLTGLKNRLLDIKIQHCQFHMVQRIIQKTTRHPKTEAGQELLKMAYMLCHTDKASFIAIFKAWKTKWHDFLREYVRDEKTHRKRYIHKNLRSASHALSTNMKWLWTYYDYPNLGIPNTNNALEGLNSHLKDI